MLNAETGRCEGNLNLKRRVGSLERRWPGRSSLAAFHRNAAYIDRLTGPARNAASSSVAALASNKRPKRCFLFCHINGTSACGTLKTRWKLQPIRSALVRTRPRGGDARVM